MSAIDDIVTSVNARHILNRYIDPTYKESRIACSYFEVLGRSYDFLEDFIKGLPKEAVINLATWGLGNWSDEYNINISQGMSYDEVRKLVREKRFHVVPPNEYNLAKYLSVQLDRECEIVQWVAPYKFHVYFFRDNHTEPFSYKRAYRIIKERRPAHLCFDLIPSQRHTYVINSQKLIFKFINPITDDVGLYAGTYPNTLYKGGYFSDCIIIEAAGKPYPFNNVFAGTKPYPRESYKIWNSEYVAENDREQFGIVNKMASNGGSGVSPSKEANVLSESQLFSIVSKYCGEDEI